MNLYKLAFQIFFQGVELAQGGGITKGATPSSLMQSCLQFAPIMDVGSQPRVCKSQDSVAYEPIDCLQDVARRITHIALLAEFLNVTDTWTCVRSKSC